MRAYIERPEAEGLDCLPALAVVDGMIGVGDSIEGE